LSLARIVAMAVASLLLACHREAPALAPGPRPAAAAIDPEIAQVDVSTVHLSQVHERLAQMVHADSQDHAVAEAIVAATADVLVLREMAVLKEGPREGEKLWQTVDRFLAAVWNAKTGCNLGKDDLRWTYLRDLGRYKHPASTTVWDAQFVCCDSSEGCGVLQEESCRKRLRAPAIALAASLRSSFARMPDLGPAADATRTTIEDSPARSRRVPEFEAQVAASIDREPKLQLRRYTFFARGEPGFEKAAFRKTDPAIESVAASLRIGEIAGPIDTAWGIDVLLIVAREPGRSGGMDRPDIKSDVMLQACEDASQQERSAYRQKLLAGARVIWNKPLIEKTFGKQALALLPPDATARELPHIPPGL